MLNFIVMLSCIFFFVGSVFSQPEGAETKFINGKEFYLHKVKSGSTIYGIHKLYNVGIEDILSANPTAKNGLSIGQELLIPKLTLTAGTQPTSDSVIIDSSQFLLHIVKKGETLYSISKSYRVDAKTLMEINGNNILTIGDQVLIPKTIQRQFRLNDEVEPAIKNPINQFAGKGDSVVLHKVKKGETLYALSKKYDCTPAEIKAANNGLPNGLKKGVEIRIPMTVTIVEKADSIVIDTNMVQLLLDTILKKEVYNIGVYLPFKLEKFYQSLQDCPQVGDCRPYIPSVRAAEFYQGVEMAVDSLKKAGLSVNLFVYDTKGDTSAMRKLLDQEEAKKMDIIFGPLSGGTQEMAAAFALQHRIQFISPVNSSNRILFKNPYVTKAVASIPTQVNEIAQYVVDSFSRENIILFTDDNVADQSYFAKVFRKKYEELTDDTLPKYRDTLVVMNRGKELKNMYQYLNKTGVNVLVVPSRNLGYVSSFLTDLNKVKNDRGMEDVSFVVFGLEGWQKFEQIDYKYINDFNVHISSAKYIDFASNVTKSFIKKFRGKYSNDPGVYSYMGFDIMMQHLAGLLHFGSGFASKINGIQLDYIHTGFDYVQVGEGSGYENKNVHILAYENYKLILKR